jgi:hypothetical protein
MDEEQQEQYLRKHGWFKTSQMLWNHKNCNYDCGVNTAVLTQQERDKVKSITQKVIERFKPILERLAKR